MQGVGVWLVWERVRACAVWWWRVAPGAGLPRADLGAGRVAETAAAEPSLDGVAAATPSLEEVGRLLGQDGRLRCVGRESR